MRVQSMDRLVFKSIYQADFSGIFVAFKHDTYYIPKIEYVAIIYSGLRI